MPQIAQQDYLRVEIENAYDITEAEKAQIKKLIENGTIFDVIFYLKPATFARVLSYDGSVITFYDPASSENLEVPYL